MYDSSATLVLGTLGQQQQQQQQQPGALVHQSVIVFPLGHSLKNCKTHRENVTFRYFLCCKSVHWTCPTLWYLHFLNKCMYLTLFWGCACFMLPLALQVKWVCISHYSWVRAFLIKQNSKKSPHTVYQVLQIPFFLFFFFTYFMLCCEFCCLWGRGMCYEYLDSIHSWTCFLFSHKPFAFKSLMHVLLFL